MIDVQQVKKLAALSRITLNPEEEERITKEFSAIIDYVEQIRDVTEPAYDRTAERHEVRNVMRADEVLNEPQSYTEDLLKNAPQRQGAYVKVKKIL